MLRLLNSRRRATVGLSLVVGCALFFLPELTSSVPRDLKPILSSGLVVGVLLAITLNLLFRIGISRQGKLLLDGLKPGAQATRFLEDCGADWGARRDVIIRAGTAVGEALEALHDARVATGQVSLEAVFDEHKLILNLVYPGLKFKLPENKAVDWQALLETEDSDTALENAVALLPGMLIRNLADKFESSERDGIAQLRLQFSN